MTFVPVDRTGRRGKLEQEGLPFERGLAMAGVEDAQTRAGAPMWSWMRPWNPNPLLRSSDRAECLLLVVVAIAVMLALPLALTIGTQIYTDDAARVRAEHARATSIDATVLTEPEWTEAHDFEAQVRWKTGDRAVTAVVAVPRRTDVGDQVPVWVDHDGALTEAPRNPVTAAFAGIGATILIWTATCLLGVGLLRGASILSGRRHAKQWEREWVLFDKPVTGDMS
ncbi:hypothetical protein GV794_05030 [Nocardia cyriacigeorgica]|uniref:Transmembrane protein n=1 Tax=Nocardia cyriacigeorgica TaxID=135487 RepID=A0A6P1CYS5_9NOCA|nr:hypothetical protein [Nocardia cyriacigeorgica]NEW37684.1 hypothetical protein [Nocardia cyriacigeorgica]NEW43276.1 hypothetical protein [Nocardia cyriacigeorgica]NEW48929.1 hypothetical protein [Nocardia cyriacigeorgica]NEW55030.1 hypothetical protein [Nocardia cyriacigeorgica]